MLHAKYLYKAALLCCVCCRPAAAAVFRGSRKRRFETWNDTRTRNNSDMILYLVLVYMRRHDIVANRLTGYLNIRSWLNRSRYCLSNIYNSGLGSGGGRLGSQ